MLDTIFAWPFWQVFKWFFGVFILLFIIFILWMTAVCVDYEADLKKKVITTIKELKFSQGDWSEKIVR